MNDKDTEQLKLKIRKLVELWQPRLGLNSFKIRFEWDRSYSAENIAIAAQVSASWQYKDALITFFLPRMAELEDDNEIEEKVVHELVHILIQPVGGDLSTKSDAECAIVEYVTTTTTWALLWTFEAGQKTPNNKESKKKK